MVASTPPGRVRLLSEVGVVLAGLAVWASVGTLDVVTTASGEVVPSSRVKVIQHLEGGIVAEILVHEGERVEKDRPLFRLDPTRAQAESEELKQRLLSLQVDIARLTAETENAAAVRFDDRLRAAVPMLVQASEDLFASRRSRLAHEIKSQAQQVVQKEQELEETRTRLRNNRRGLEIVTSQVTISENLVSKDLSNRMSHLDLLRQQQSLRTLVDADQSAQPRLEAALLEAKERLAWVEGSAIEQARRDLATARQQFDELSQRLLKFRNIEERTVVRAPVDGIVKTVNVTTEGGVIQPGQTLAEVVPAGDHLVIEARLPIQDIGYVHADQPAKIALNSSDSSAFRPISGSVARVSPDATVTNDGHAFYRVRILPEQTAFEGTGRRYQLYPGMQVVCSVRIGQRTILEYLLSPWFNAMRFAFQEK
ncbi:HlyD family type I secretion periplasmic adaptor subunit [Azospirillum sp. sgz302134]